MLVFFLLRIFDTNSISRVSESNNSKTNVDRCSQEYKNTRASTWKYKTYVKQTYKIYNCEGTRTHNHLVRKRIFIQLD